MDNKGLTLLEILVAVLILALVMVGIANVFIASRRHLGYSRSKIQAMQLGRLFLAPLQKDVTMGERSLGAQDGWQQTNNCLSSNGTSPGCPDAETTLGPITYHAPTYEITPVADTTLRKVKVTITWDEPKPQ